MRFDLETVDLETVDLKTVVSHRRVFGDGERLDGGTHRNGYHDLRCHWLVPGQHVDWSESGFDVVVASVSEHTIQAQGTPRLWDL